MKSRSLKKYDFNNQVEQFFPKQVSRKLSLKNTIEEASSKLPYLYNKIHHNTIEKSLKKSKKHKRSISSYDVTDFQPSKHRHETKLFEYLSSKVDFFNQQNQKRLDIQKRKVLIDLGILRFQKQKIVPGRVDSTVPPALAKLLQQYLIKRNNSDSLSEDYYVLGREV